MPSNQKRRVRARQQKTGESYQAAVQAMRGPEIAPEVPGWEGVMRASMAEGLGNLAAAISQGVSDGFRPLSFRAELTIKLDGPGGNIRTIVCSPEVTLTTPPLPLNPVPYSSKSELMELSAKDEQAFQEAMKLALTDPDYKLVTNYQKGTLPLNPILGLLDVQPDEVAVKLARKTPSGACLGVAPFCPYMLYDLFGRDDRLAVRVWVGRSIAQDLLLWNASPLDWVSHLEERRKGHIADLSGGIQVWQLPAKRLDPNSIVVIYDGEGEDDLKPDWAPPPDRIFHIQRS